MRWDQRLFPPHDWGLRGHNIRAIINVIGDNVERLTWSWPQR
jgi:hypothetical protein